MPVSIPITALVTGQGTSVYGAQNTRRLRRLPVAFHRPLVCPAARVFYLAVRDRMNVLNLAAFPATRQPLGELCASVRPPFALSLCLSRLGRVIELARSDVAPLLSYIGLDLIFFCSTSTCPPRRPL